MMSPMNTFFCVKETIPPGMGFSLFSSGHLIWLASIALVTVLAALLYRKSSDKTRFIIRLVISILLLADEAVKQILLFSTGQFNWDYLPLHLCSINIFIVLIHVITGSRYVAEALFALCLPAAAAALLFCSWTMLPLLNLMTIHSFTVHALLFMYPVMLLAGGFRPDVKKLVRIIPLMSVSGPVSSSSTGRGKATLFLSLKTRSVVRGILFLQFCLSSCCGQACIHFLLLSAEERKEKCDNFMSAANPFS